MVTSEAIETVSSEEGAAAARFDELDNMMLDPQHAARMVAGLGPETVCYVILRKGKKPIIGVSTRGAQILAVRRGHFETLPDITFSNGIVPLQLNDTEGAVAGEQDVASIRAMVRVRDTRSVVTFVGVAEEPQWMALKYGGMAPDTKAAIKAVNKAERNALNKHFAPLTEMIEKLAEEAKRKGHAVIMEEEDAPRNVTPRSMPRASVTSDASPTYRPQENNAGPTITQEQRQALVAELTKAKRHTHAEFGKWCADRGTNLGALSADLYADAWAYVGGEPPEAVYDADGRPIGQGEVLGL